MNRGGGGWKWPIIKNAERFPPQTKNSQLPKHYIDNISNNLYNPDMARGDSYQLQGQQGGQVYTSADGAVTGSFRWIQIVNDTVFSAIASPNVTNASTKLITITHPAGTGLGGLFTGFTVTSGVVIAYTA
jgi:hypothetical protein